MSAAPASAALPERLRFGIFLAPYHAADENPLQSLERDLALVAHLDRLGFDEAWIGEHHSGGVEIIASPELFIAAAARDTQRIRLGTGVSSLPYHHPLLLADRVMQLDYQTRGRFMFGVGPGALSSDAFMMGIDPLKQREMMEEALDVLVPLLEGQTVTRRTDWFTLENARLQFAPYTRPRVEMAVAAMTSPSGPRNAGKHGLGLLSIGATTGAGYLALAEAWRICEEAAALNGHTVQRRNWRAVGPMHIAETREQAREQVRWGLPAWVHYYTHVIALPFKLPDDLEGQIDTLISSGFAVIGDPDDAAAQIERIQQQSGGVGAFLCMAHNWADWAATQRSYELIARYVMPRFQHSTGSLHSSMNWVAENRERFMGATRAAKEQATAAYQQSRGGTKAKDSGTPND